jgi:hypothetical protein
MAVLQLVMNQLKVLSNFDFELTQIEIANNFYAQ